MGNYDPLSLLGSAASGAFGLATQALQNKYNQATMAKQFEYNSQLAEQQQNYNVANMATANQYSRQNTADSASLLANGARAAGLNPAYGTGQVMSQNATSAGLPSVSSQGVGLPTSPDFSTAAIQSKLVDSEKKANEAKAAKDTADADRVEQLLPGEVRIQKATEDNLIKTYENLDKDLEVKNMTIASIQATIDNTEMDTKQKEAQIKLIEEQLPFIAPQAEAVLEQTKALTEKAKADTDLAHKQGKAALMQAKAALISANAAQRSADAAYLVGMEQISKMAAEKNLTIAQKNLLYQQWKAVIVRTRSEANTSYWQSISQEWEAKHPWIAHFFGKLSGAVSTVAGAAIIAK